jgi:glycosyltransferase involved in cell wall biosynthesis
MPGNDRLRLLFINHWAAHLGGAEHSLIDILAEAAQRADVFLVTAESGALAERAAAMGVTVRTLFCAPGLGAVRRGGLVAAGVRQWRGMLSFARFVLRLRALVASINPHLIHANVPKSHVALFLLVRLGFRGKTCYHVREIFAPRSAPYRLYSLLFPPRNARVLAISNAVRESVPLRMKLAARVAYNGVQITSSPAPRERPHQALRFVYLGRVVPWKGCHLLVEAFSRV